MARKTGEYRVTRAGEKSVCAFVPFPLPPANPMVTPPAAIRLMEVSKPTAIKALDALQQAGILRETTGKKRDRVYAYHGYLQVLKRDTE